MRFWIASALLIGSAATTAADSSEPLKLRLDGGVRPLQYAVDLTVIPDRDAFQGSIDIALDIRASSQTVWLNATGLEILQASFQPESGASQPARPAPDGDQRMGFAFEHPVSGRGVLHVAYQGAISRRSSAGLFQMEEGGEWYIYSQFEPTDARRAFPCFDEPGFKVPWQMTLHVPRQDLAVSNTPVLSESDEPGGMKTVKFKTSPPLPSYLVALAVGRFDVVDAGKVGKIPLRVVVPRGKAGEAQYAASAIPELLKLLEGYTGIPYPYEKLDSVVMPVSDFAMENAGLITYGESMLLANPSVDTINHRRELVETCAHEMAHQWFGDLVTTAWWDDTWLNEAFATWMERKIPGEWKPEWQLDILEVTSRQGAMSQDQLASARKIRQPIESYDDIANAFDDITYDKGAAVLVMFERWIGPGKFRQGVHNYLEQHAWGNATAKDFEEAISAAAGRNIAPVLDSFLDQAGVPEVSVKLQCGSRPRLELAQKRSLPIGSQARQQTWQIPVCVQYGSDGAVHHQCQVLSDPKSEMELTEAQTCPSWVLPNDGETGYYQVHYEGDLLQDVLAGRGGHLTAAERLGVLGDVNALVGSGEVAPQVALALVPEFAADPAWQVVRAAVSIAAMLRGEEVPDELRAKGAQFIRQTFGPRAAALGWVAKPGESDDTRLLRQMLVPFVARAGGQRELVDQAGKLARDWLQGRRSIDPEMVNPVLDVAAQFGNRELFNQLRDAAVAERDHHLRESLLEALGSFRNPGLAQASLDLLLSKDFDPREAFYALLFGPLAHAETRDLPFQFVKQHLDQLLARLPREVGEDYAAGLPQVGSAFCDASRRAELDSFFRGRVKSYTGGPRNLAQTLEGIDLCIAQRKTLAPGLAEFLDRY